MSVMIEMVIVTLRVCMVALASSTVGSLGQTDEDPEYFGCGIS